LQDSLLVRGLRETRGACGSRTRPSHRHPGRARSPTAHLRPSDIRDRHHDYL